MLSRAAVQAARGVLQQDLVRDKQTGQFFDDAPTDLWAFPIEKYAIGDGFMTAKIEDERGKLNLNDLASIDPNARKGKILRAKRLFHLLQINPDLVDAIVDWVDVDDIPGTSWRREHLLPIASSGLSRGERSATNPPRDAINQGDDA